MWAGIKTEQKWFEMFDTFDLNVFQQHRLDRFPSQQNACGSPVQDISAWLQIHLQHQAVK